MSPLLERILRESDSSSILDVLSERLSPTDLQSLLLEVYRRRAAQQTPARMLDQYEQNRFVHPSPTDPRLLLQFDTLAFSLAAPAFEPIELAPVCPLGTTSAVAPISQNKTIATIRNTETVSDSTNFMAMECALRRRSLLRSTQKHQRVRLCSSHRLLRTQYVAKPGFLAHFRLFGLCTAGRDEGSFRFELETLTEQIAFYLGLLASLRLQGFALQEERLLLTAWDSSRYPLLEREVMEPLKAQLPDLDMSFAPERTTGRGYYREACFHLYARDSQGNEHLLVDGGFTDWTQQLLNNQKERYLISGIGSERICSLFYPAK